MAQTSTAVRLFRRVRGRLARSRPDFGDHGTAIGLDLSIAEAHPHPAGAPVQQPPARQFGFWRRKPARDGGSTG